MPTICNAPDCTKLAGGGQLMCDKHWAKVPPALQTAVTRTYEDWRDNRGSVQAFQAHRAAIDAATRAVDPWHLDLTGYCCCPCHRGAGNHGDHDCICADVRPASCLTCRDPIAVHAIHPDHVHGDITTTCPAIYSTWTPIAGVTPAALRTSMRDPQLELTGATP